MNSTFEIKSTDKSILKRLQAKIDSKTKPLGALGHLEDLALKIGAIQNTETPILLHPSIVVFAGDHGLADEDVSQYPKEVTAQMVLNFLADGAAINVFAKQNLMELYIVDAGVDFNFDQYHPHFLNKKVGEGTNNSLEGSAMTSDEFNQCLHHGKEVVQGLVRKGCNVVGFGEMGIGNTSSASLIMSQLLDLPIEDCAGRGTGLDDTGLNRKIEILKNVQDLHKNTNSAEEVLQAFAGFEIVQMIGAILQAAASKMVVMVDGFIASVAFLAASKINSDVKDYAIFCHASAEQGHQLLLEHLEAEPILNLGMRLGEGTGCAVAYPILESSVNFLNKMASFESAGVSRDQ